MGEDTLPEGSDTENLHSTVTITFLFEDQYRRSPNESTVDRTSFRAMKNSILLMLNLIKLLTAEYRVATNP